MRQFIVLKFQLFKMMHYLLLYSENNYFMHVINTFFKTIKC